jgi:hypothetical protein
VTFPASHGAPAGAPDPAVPPLPPAPPPLLQRGRRRAPQRVSWWLRKDVRAGALFALALAAIGAALGPLWAWWAPSRQPGYVIAPHLIQPVGESESFIAGDGRYAVLTLGVGLLAGAAAWTRRSVRGPVVAVAVALGALAGGLLTEFVGHRLGGGRDHGAVNTIVAHLPLTVHAHALRVVEPLAAVLVYAVCAAFAGPDDLGVGDGPPADVSIGMGSEA